MPRNYKIDQNTNLTEKNLYQEELLSVINKHEQTVRNSDKLYFLQPISDNIDTYVHTEADRLKNLLTHKAKFWIKQLQTNAKLPKNITVKTQENCYIIIDRANKTQTILTYNIYSQWASIQYTSQTVHCLLCDKPHFVLDMAYTTTPNKLRILNNEYVLKYNNAKYKGAF